MATSVTATDQVNQYLHKLVVSIVSQNVEANTTKVKYVYTVTRSGPSANGSWTALNNVTFTATINGVSHTATPNFDFRTQTTLTVMSGTQTISHGGDGTKSINVRLQCTDLPGSIWFFAADSGNKPLALTDIPRASDFTLTPPSVIDGGSTSIDITRVDTDYTHTVEWATDTDGGVIDTDVETHVDYTPDSALLTGLDFVGITITVTTFDGATQIGDPVTHDLLFRTPPEYPEVGQGTPYDIRFRRTELDGSDWVIKETIPFTDADLTDALSASGSCSFSVPTGIYSEDLDEAVVVVDVYDGSQWINANQVFLLTRTEGDLTDLDGVVKYSGVSFVDFLLSKAIVSNEPKETTKSAGYFMQTYFDAAKNRGWGPFVKRGFSSTRTSVNTTWKSTTELDVARDTPLSQILDGLVSDVLCEYRTRFEYSEDDSTWYAYLDLYNPGYGLDWTTADADPVVNLATAALWKVADKAPVRKDASDKITRMFVRGDGKNTATRESDTAVNPLWGHLEGSIDAAGVKSVTRLNHLGDAALKLNATAVVERTFSYDLSSTQTPTQLYPYRTFRVGDWVLIPGESGLERVRVSQIALSRDSDSVTATITVGDMIPSSVFAIARKQAQVGGGAISAGTLGGTPRPLSSTIPAAPNNVVATPDGYWDATGAPKAGIALTWDEVDSSLDGNSLDVDLYEVWTRAELGSPWTLALISDITSATIAPLNINESLDIQVRARSVDGAYGDWSDVVEATTPEPDETLPAPSNPTLDSNALGTVTIHWNGLIDGSTPPLWFNYAIAEISDAEAGAYTQAGGQLVQAGDITVDNIGPGTWWFRLVGYDTLNVRGDTSDAVSIAVTVELGDTRQPKTPTDLAVTSTGFWNAAHAESRIDVSFTEVTQATDDSSMDVPLYEVWGKLSTESAYRLLTSGAGSPISFQPITPLDATWNIVVRAQGSNNVWSEFTSAEDVVIDAPDMDMWPPTAPNLTSSRGVLSVGWDGQTIDDSGSDDDDGGVVYPAPDYLASVDIQVSVDEGDEWVSVGFLGRGEYTQYVGGLGIGTVAWVRFVAYDVLGQASNPSNISTIEIEGIDGADIIAGTINGNRVIAGSISADLVTPTFGSDLDISANGTVSIISGQVADAQATADAAQDNLDTMRTRYDFTPTEAVISQPGSVFQVAISNTQLEFREAGVARAYLNAGVFTAPQMAATQLLLTSHVIEDDPDGTVIKRL